MKSKPSADPAPANVGTMPPARVFKSCDPTWPKWGATPAGWNTQTKWFDSEREAREYAKVPSARPHDENCGCFSCREYDGTEAPANVGSQHTPGPWAWSGHSGHVWSKDSGKHIATVRFTRLGYGDDPDKAIISDTARADANLIAAAPEMFEALKKLVEYCEAFDDFPIACRNARATLAKIGGRE